MYLITLLLVCNISLISCGERSITPENIKGQWYYFNTDRTIEPNYTEYYFGEEYVSYTQELWNGYGGGYRYLIVDSIILKDLGWGRDTVNNEIKFWLKEYHRDSMILETPGKNQFTFYKMDLVSDYYRYREDTTVDGSVRSESYDRYMEGFWKRAYDNKVKHFGLPDTGN